MISKSYKKVVMSILILVLFTTFFLISCVEQQQGEGEEESTIGISALTELEETTLRFSLYLFAEKIAQLEKKRLLSNGISEYELLFAKIVDKYYTKNKDNFDLSNGETQYHNFLVDNFLQTVLQGNNNSFEIFNDMFLKKERLGYLSLGSDKITFYLWKDLEKPKSLCHIEINNKLIELVYSYLSQYYNFPERLVQDVYFYGVFDPERDCYHVEKISSAPSGDPKDPTITKFISEVITLFNSTYQKIKSEDTSTYSQYNLSDFQDINDAITQIGAEKSLLIIDETVSMQSITIPQNIVLSITENGKIFIETGNTLTIEGRVKAGLYQVFMGDGDVNGLKEVYPEWFGASGDGQTDDSLPLAYALSYPDSTVFLSGNYYIDSGLLVEGIDRLTLQGKVGARLTVGANAQINPQWALNVHDLPSVSGIEFRNCPDIHLDNISFFAPELSSLPLTTSGEHNSVLHIFVDGSNGLSLRSVTLQSKSTPYRGLDVNEANSYQQKIEFVSGEDTNIINLNLSWPNTNDSHLDIVERMKNLRVLNLKSSQVTDNGISKLKDLVGLTSLNLESTSIGDNGLGHLINLVNLANLNLSRTNVSSQGLESIKNMAALSNLDLSWNKNIDNAGLAHLASLQNVLKINLLGTNITDAGVEHLKALNLLVYLNLEDTQVTGNGLVHVRDVDTLEELYLRGLNITDNDIGHLAGLTKLKTLELGGTNIGNIGLENIKHLNELEKLDLMNTQITDDSVTTINNFTKLIELDLSMNGITDKGLERLNLTGLKTIYLYDTQVTATGITKLKASLPQCQIYF